MIYNVGIIMDSKSENEKKVKNDMDVDESSNKFILSDSNKEQVNIAPKIAGKEFSEDVSTESCINSVEGNKVLGDEKILDSSDAGYMKCSPDVTNKNDLAVLMSSSKMSPERLSMILEPHNSKDQLSDSIPNPESPKGGLIFNFDDKKQQLLFDLGVVHECNLDKKFLIDPKHEPPKNLMSILAEKVAGSYWQTLEEQLNSDPPIMDEALKLVKDIKRGIESVLLPWHNRIREEMSEVLDEELIKQQAENNAFDFKKCAQYIISLMLKLCAPVRDKEIADLKEIEGIVPLFKGIFRVLNLMRVDMINYHLISLRTILLNNGRKYERDKFDQFLTLSGTELIKTKKWLAKYSPVPSGKNKKSVLERAFLEFLNLEDITSAVLPEPLALDAERYSLLSEQYFLIIISATIVVISCGYLRCGEAVLETFRSTLKDNLLVLLKGAKSDEHISRVMPNLIEQIVKTIRDQQSASGAPIMSEEDKQNLLSHLKEIGPNHPVRLLMKERLNDAIIHVMSSVDTPPPPSLQQFTQQIQQLAQPFSLIVNHSIAVYGDYFYAYLLSENSNSN